MQPSRMRRHHRARKPRPRRLPPRTHRTSSSWHPTPHDQRSMSNWTTPVTAGTTSPSNQGLEGDAGTDADVAAEFTDAPRFNGHPLNGDRFIAAHASKSGRSVIVYVCFEHVPGYAAGRWEGTIAVFGPKLSDFTYAIVVTTKWPRWTAWLTILVTIAGSMIVAILTGVLKTPTDWRGGLRVFFTLVVALALGLVPYWSVYASNETWGSTPNSDLIALVSATFGAVIAGFALAKRLLSA